MRSRAVEAGDIPERRPKAIYRDLDGNQIGIGGAPI